MLKIFQKLSCQDCFITLLLYQRLVFILFEKCEKKKFMRLIHFILRYFISIIPVKSCVKKMAYVVQVSWAT